MKDQEMRDSDGIGVEGEDVGWLSGEGKEDAVRVSRN